MSVQEGLGEAGVIEASVLGGPVGLEPTAPDLDDLMPVLDLTQARPGSVDAPPHPHVHHPAPAGWLRARVAVVHAALRRPWSIAVDLILVWAAVSLTTGRLPAQAAWVTTFLACGLLFGLWQTRSSVQAYGTAWYLKALVAPLLTTAVCAFALGQMSATSADEATFIALALLAGVHSAAWLGLVATRRTGRGLASTLLVGSATDTKGIARRLEVYPEMGLAVIGTCDPDRDLIAGADGHEMVERILNTWAPAHVLCVDSPGTEDVFKDLVAFGQDRVELTLALPLTRITGSGRRLGDVGLIPVKTRRAWGVRTAKRVFDVVAASLMLLAVSPVLAATAIAIRLDDHGPVMFRQKRPGLHGVPFEILKFRSMVAGSAVTDSYLSKLEVGSFTYKVRADPRVTRVGRLIRRLSIDELPQLFNVIRGDMSLVGPRPLAFDPEEYQGRARLRHSVRPGITGLWQVSGANALEDNDMIELDLNYVANHSLGLDLLLLLRTVSAVAIRRAPV